MAIGFSLVVPVGVKARSTNGVGKGDECMYAHNNNNIITMA